MSALCAVCGHPAGSHQVFANSEEPRGWRYECCLEPRCGCDRFVLAVAP